MPESAEQDAPSGSFSRWLTLANAISLGRVVAAPATLYAIFAGLWPLAAGLFAAAVVSDFLDGWIARRRGTASTLGGIVDHASDAIYVTVTLWAIAYAEAQTRSDLVPGILPLFIALAFLQYLLDSKALVGQPLRTSRLGRINGIAYFVVAGTVIGHNALDPVWLPEEVIYWAAMGVVVSTLASMFDRLRALMKTEPH